MGVHCHQFAAAFQFHSMVSDPFQQIVEGNDTWDSRHKEGDVPNGVTVFLEWHNTPRQLRAIQRGTTWLTDLERALRITVAMRCVKNRLI